MIMLHLIFRVFLFVILSGFIGCASTHTLSPKYVKIPFQKNLDEINWIFPYSGKRDLYSKGDLVYLEEVTSRGRDVYVFRQKTDSFVKVKNLSMLKTDLLCLDSD